MKVVDSEVNAAGRYAIAAILDARMKNSVGITHYTDKQVARANSMKYVLEMCYAAKDIYINYRQKFITVKVDGAQVKDRRMLAELVAGWEKEGIYRVDSKQGVMYRIPA